jgi:hypothetical protein
MIYYPANSRENDALTQWAADRIPHVRGGDFGPCQALAAVAGNSVRAVVVFHDWQPRHLTIQASVAAESPRWATKENLREVFRYAFDTVKANKLWAAVPHDAARVLKFNAGIGLKPEATLRSHFGHKRHAVIGSMMRSEWARSRWHSEAPNG